ncbi:MAG: Asp23/Gls24 family envelope stress response protein [Oscillospiraceae bacterium]|nr:Asp23/Gls24 family envelope stress response protein [Oscillospiraceae bacterium]
MKGIKETAKSRLKISEDVVITVARLAALDVKGVAGLSGEDDKLSRLCGKAPIRTELMGDVVSIEIKLVVAGDARACTVAQAVQAAVKENVQTMTGVTVARVNVIIDDICFE